MFFYLFFSADSMAILQDMYDNSQKKLQKLEDAIPIKVIEKCPNGKYGAISWGLEMWEMILEPLVNGMPPSSMDKNIVSFVCKFSPSTTMNELPSIYLIRQAMMVLLVIVPTLAAYRPTKAYTWEQSITNGTSRW